MLDVLLDSDVSYTEIHVMISTKNANHGAENHGSDVNFGLRQRAR